MHDRHEIARRIVGLLDDAGVRYTLCDHRPVLTYDDIAAVAAGTDRQGTEMRSLVQKTGDDFVVYVTLQGTRAGAKAMKKHLGTKTLRMASDEDLADTFGAAPGNAYPFGFDACVRAIVDLAVDGQEWLLFSPCRPGQTVQVRGADLEKAFGSLPDPVEVLALNQG